ncbi:MAG: helix-turn-helix transcriptional regulator [Bacillota bacterium]
MIKLAELRAQRKLTQKGLASALGLSKSAIGMYESGRRTPRLPIAKKIARYFGVPVETISFGDKRTGAGP